MNMKSVDPVSCFFRKTTVLLMSTGRSVGQNSPIQGAVGGTNEVDAARVVLDLTVVPVKEVEGVEDVKEVVSVLYEVAAVGQLSPMQGAVGGVLKLVVFDVVCDDVT